MSRLSYYRWVFAAYLTKRNSQLTFWHGTPQVNENVDVGKMGEYYMPFTYKADYKGSFDDKGIPLLNYHGAVGKQHNPIAIAQYALGHYNLFKRTRDKKHLGIFLNQANWLVENLELNSQGLYVWNHHFDWEYRGTLKAPWYSALAQGQGISALVRAYLETKKEKYLHSTRKAFETFKHETKECGVVYTDKNGYVWLEEVIVDPPSHILNGFIWALWGIYDYYLATNDELAFRLFNRCVETLRDNLHKYDTGFWSLYELPGTRVRMLTSYFYHSLHVVQLRVMYKLAGEPVFKDYADRWEGYRKNKLFRLRALAQKSIFKLLYY